MRGPQAHTPRRLNETFLRIGALVAFRHQASLRSFHAPNHLPGARPAGAYHFFGTLPRAQRVVHFELRPRVQFTRLGSQDIFRKESFLFLGQFLP